MLNAYGILKFLHVLSVVVWVGGIAALSVVAWRLRSEGKREALQRIAGRGRDGGSGAEFRWRLRERE